MRTAALVALLVARMAQPPAPRPAPLVWSPAPGIDPNAIVLSVEDATQTPFAKPAPRPTPGRPPIFIPRLPIVLAPQQRVVIAPRPRTGKGAVIGALAGMGTGIVFGLVDPVSNLKRKDAVAVGALLFGGLGAYVGHQFDF